MTSVYLVSPPHALEDITKLAMFKSKDSAREWADREAKTYADDDGVLLVICDSEIWHTVPAGTAA